MSHKSRLYYLSVIALTLSGLTNEARAQDDLPAVEKPVAEEQAKERTTE